MDYVLIVQGGPADSGAPRTCLRFAKALIRRGHRLKQVFFYRAAVETAVPPVEWPADEPCIPDDWQDFAASRGLALTLCVSSALRRGVAAGRADTANETGESSTEGAGSGSVWRHGGLGELVAAITAADRVVTFGG